MKNGRDEQPVDYDRSIRASGASGVGTGGSVVQNNQISTPVLITFLVAFMVLGIASGWALALAQTASTRGLLAQEAAMNLRATMRAHGIKTDPNGLENDNEEEEPIEP